MDGRNPHELRQALKYFEPDNPYYYQCPVFRVLVLKLVFLKFVKRIVGRVLGIPYGLREEDPQVDDVSDQTFDSVGKKLDGERVAKLSSALARYALCYTFIMTVAWRKAITYKRKHPYVYQHGDFEDDLRGQEPVTHTEYKSFEADIDEADREERFRQKFLKVLSPVMSKRDSELIWLRKAKKWEYRDLSPEFEKSIEALRVRVHRLWPKAEEILSDPSVQRYLFGEDGEDDAKHD